MVFPCTMYTLITGWQLKTSKLVKALRTSPDNKIDKLKRRRLYASLLNYVTNYILFPFGGLNKKISTLIIDNVLFSIAKILCNA